MFRRVLAAMLAVAGPAAAESQRFFTDGVYYVYREEQSCALYADYPEDVMLRVSYRPRSERVFLSVVAPMWTDRIKVGEGYTAVLYFREDLNNGFGFPVVGMMQPGDEDHRVGVSGLAPPDFLRRLERTEGVLLSIDGKELTRMTTSGVRVAVGKLISCSMAYFQ